MNIFEQIVYSTEKPSVVPIKKNEKQQIMAIGLGQGTVLKEHKTSVQATLIVMKGEVDFNMNNTTQSFKEGEVFEIPVDVLHEVIGINEENIFLIIKEL